MVGPGVTLTRSEVLIAPLALLARKEPRPVIVPLVALAALLAYLTARLFLSRYLI